MAGTNPSQPNSNSLLRQDGSGEETVFFSYADPLDTPETLINPFVSSSTSTTVRRQRLRERASSSTSTPVSLSNALPVFNVEDASRAEDECLRSQSEANYLEMEKTPSRLNLPKNDDEDLLGYGLEPLSTTSGLLLTHRQTAPSVLPSSSSFRKVSGDMEFPSTSKYHKNGGNPYLHSLAFDARRWLSATKLWLILFCFVLAIGTVTIWHSSHHEDVSSPTNGQVYTTSSEENINETYDQIILLPMPSNFSTVSQESSATNSRRRLFAKPPPLENYRNELTSTSGERSPSSLKKENAKHKHGKDHHEDHTVLEKLRHEFETWMKKHGKSYHSHHEKERRFHIFKENHHRTLAKNERHGPCRMTKEAVFGHNVFSDLTQEEFQSQFLTGYKGPKTDLLHKSDNSRGREKKSSEWGHVLDPKYGVELHPNIQAKLENNPEHRKLFHRINSYSYSGSCAWYEISCWLRWFVNKFGYGWGGTLEPYNSNNYPGAVDWRNAGVVSDVHSQGNCGACWAITAVETIESAYAMSSGTLIDLAETEVILCDDTCDMCEGGWPQNAYEYVAAKGGLPQEKYLQYDGDFLLGLTYSKNEEYGYDTDTYESYVQQMCPGGGGGGGSHSGSGSNDNDNNYNYDGSQLPRYGKPKGYGYATDRCVCYTDGSGCDCDEQDEKLALNNVASYGPATVCMEASTWQDYAGGIMTSEIGCSASFLDMNHCVQAVGYAYIDSSDEDNGEDEGNSNSHSNSHSRDDSEREGYWIIRNQWSSNWGMNGYAYVAMGENTCGVLNDMTIVYMK